MPDAPDNTLKMVKKDIRNIMVAQEAYRRDHGGYAPDWFALSHATGLRLSAGNVADIVGDATGHKATVRSDGTLAASRQCSVHCGSAAEVAGKEPRLIEVDA
jgi:hypothetical protein